MNQTSLDMRNQEARRKIKSAAQELALALDVPALQTPSTVEQRQPVVAQMRELECIAVLLEAIVGELTHGSQEEGRRTAV